MSDWNLFLSANLVIFQKSIMLSSQLGDQDEHLTLSLPAFVINVNVSCLN